MVKTCQQHVLYYELNQKNSENNFFILFGDLIKLIVIFYFIIWSNLRPKFTIWSKMTILWIWALNSKFSLFIFDWFLWNYNNFISIQKIQIHFEVENKVLCVFDVQPLFESTTSNTNFHFYFDKFQMQIYITYEVKTILRLCDDIRVSNW